MKFDSVKDSGERQQWDTGSQRDSQAGKGRFDLIPLHPIERLAIHFENGAKKYGDDNWKLGQPLSQYVNSAMRHVFKVSEGWTDEDHPAALMWNAQAFMWTKNEIDHGRLPKELDDIKWADGGDFPFEAPPLVSSWDGTVIRGEEGPVVMGGPVDDAAFSLGDVALCIGDPVGKAELEQLPPGTIIRFLDSTCDYVREKMDDQRWWARGYRAKSAVLPSRHIADEGWFLEYLPD